MKRKQQQIYRYFITVIFGMIAQVAIAQQNQCGTTIADFKKSNTFASRINQNSCFLPRPVATTVDTIPIVVHIVFTNPTVGLGDNISDQQVFAAIAKMNSNFRNDQKKGADAQMYFILARSGPNGEITNGIVRVDGRRLAGYAQYGASFSILPGANSDSVKSLSFWSNTDYLNIWCVTKIAGSFDGKSLSNPMDPLEGLVIAASNFKSTEKALTHEMGHFFWLRHTFEGETANGCSSDDDCQNQGDGLCDTPLHRHNDYTSSQCPNPNGLDWNNSFHNFMSYNYSDSCDRFTADGVAEIRAALATRPSLLRSSGLVSPQTPIEINVVAIANSDIAKVCDSVSVKVIVQNRGSIPTTSMTFDIYSDDIKVATKTAAGIHIMPRATDTISLPRIPIAFGTANIKCVAVGFNSQSADYLLQNNAACANITFEPAYFMISADVNPHGIIYGSGGVQCGDQVNLDFYPDRGYQWKQWLKNGQPTSWAQGHSFTATESMSVSVETESIVTGITNNSNGENGFTLFPNPATDILQIKSNTILACNVEIYDVIGQKMYSTTFNSDERLMTINLDNLSSGNYYIRFQTDSITETQSFIKK